jgi:hypothetical protein
MKMIKRDYLIIIILLIIILALSTAIIGKPESDNNDTSVITREVLANDSHDPGSVEVIRNIGNPNSKRIAYVVGVHPLEHQTHETLVKMLPKLSDLNYCYDIYIINVTEDIGHYGEGYSDTDDPGRQNGQNLALKYVYPEIVNGDYELTVDVHSNIGAYPYKTFVFSPVRDSLSVGYAEEIARNSQNITYYSPDSTTSGPYLTIPLNENGVPAFYFEEYSFASQSVKDSHMLELIRAVDNLELSS